MTAMVPIASPDSTEPTADDLVVSALGNRLRIRCGPLTIREPLRRLLESLITFDGQLIDGDGTASITVLEDAVGRRLIGPDAQVTMLPEGGETAEVLRLVNATLISRSPYLCAHAAVLSVSDGALAILAASGAGKSTTTAAGLREGLGYLSDEVLAVEWPDLDLPDPGRPGGQLPVMPYPRPLGLSSWSCRALGLDDAVLLAEDVEQGEHYVSPAALTARIHRSPRTLGHVVLLGPPREEVRLVPLSRRDAVAALLQRAFNAWRNPASAFRLAHHIAATADCWLLEPGSPRQTGELLREHFGTDGAD